MPKAVSRSYDDRHAGSGRGWLGPALDLFRRRPVDTLAGLAAAAGVATILVNALALQEGRHPAPLFQDGAASSASRAAPPAAAPQRSELVAQIQDGLAARGLYDGAVDGLMGAKTSAAILAFEQAAKLPATGQASERVLGALLIAPARKDPAVPSSGTPWRAAPTPPAKAPAAAPATTGSVVSGPKLMAVQRALGRLGYGPVTIDGKMGSATRTAILSFERDRKLPQTGEPGAQVLRELQAVSGASLE